MRERNSATSTSMSYRAAPRTRQAACWLGLGLLFGVAGCSGDSSILDPAGPAARDVRLIWWVMLVFATVVLVGVTVVWLYAFKPHNVERTPAQERRIARRWIIGGWPRLAHCQHYGAADVWRARWAAHAAAAAR